MFFHLHEDKFRVNCDRFMDISCYTFLIFNNPTNLMFFSDRFSVFFSLHDEAAQQTVKLYEYSSCPDLITFIHSFILILLLDWRIIFKGQGLFGK